MERIALELLQYHLLEDIFTPLLIMMVLLIVIIIIIIITVVGRRRIVQCGVHLTATENESKQDVEAQIVGPLSPTQPSPDSPTGLEAAATSTAQVAATATPPQPNTAAPRAGFVEEGLLSQKDAL